jgi:single-stranded-DNA-specific exonuclease
MTYKWNFREPTQEELQCRDNLVAELGYTPTTALLLAQRGITSGVEARQFFRPNLKDLHDPFLMDNMDKAVKRLNKALGDKEKILIYGDYDVDGITAVTLVYKYLRPYSSTLDYYIPDRYDEGYGVSYKSIDYALDNGVTLIITLDCGIKAAEQIALAKEHGIDFIICDHHVPDDQLPEAVAILDSKCPGSTYPYEHLSGCGVGFKFMQAFAKNNGFPFSDLEKLLELTAVSIAADIVPITGENRVLIYYGLKQLNDSPSLGLKGILDICGLEGKEITLNDIIFRIGPRINASGRMMNGKEAVDLLLAKDSESVREKSENINFYNDERRELDKRITDEANAIVDRYDNMEDHKAIVLYDPAWHKGVVGIVASRLADKYHRPAVVLTLSSEGLITGSARSNQGFDVYKATEGCRDLLENFGGHTYATGLSLKKENLDAFTERFLYLAAEEINIEQMTPQLDVDAVIQLNEISPKLANELKRMEPFGPDNQKPLFCSKKVKDFGTSKLVGKDNEHIKLKLVDDTVKTPVHAIAFGMYQHGEHIKSDNPFDICYAIEENIYNGRRARQLMIKDIKSDTAT